MVDDPIKPVVDALAQVFAKPKGVANDPDSYKSGTADPANPALTGAITTLLGVLYTASADMAGVGTSIKQALTDVANVVSALGDAIRGLPAPVGDVANAMSQLQQGLAVAQTLAPTSTAAVLDPAGKLFSQIQNLLTAVPDPKQAAIELYSLAQQFRLIATQIKP
jgi:ABC-type transporter Mla subunit MlaD